MPGRWTLLTAAVLGVGAACVVGACATQADNPVTPPPPVVDSGPPDTTPAACVNMNTIRCGLNCTDPQKDPANCGKCGVECGMNRFCSSGACANSCLPPTTQCNNTSGTVCANLNTDHDNCGKCGNACASTEDCVPSGTSAVCQKHCDPGLTLCAPDCSNLRTDVNHCGDCNTTCDTSSGETCSEGLCCPAGQTNCGGTCVNQAYDSNNCGACGFTCGGPTPYCIKSACQTCNPGILVLNQGAASDTTAVISSLTTAGALATSGGAPSSFTASTSASKFGAVLMITGGGGNMPSSGQTDIATAFGKGVGLVVIDYYFNYYSSCCSYFSSIYPLMPETGSTAFGSYQMHTLTEVGSGSPIWKGISSPFTRTGYEYGWPVANKGGTVVATTSEGPSVIVKDVSGSNGRVVYINLALGWSGSWTGDTNMLKLVTNAATWATNCL